MRNAQVAEALAFKRQLETAFVKAAGLSGRRQASAIYSLPQKCPVLWLNLNPGGDEDNCVILSDDEIADGKHEYFNGHGATSEETGACLRALFAGEGDRVRSVQGSNVVWERSPDADQVDLNKGAREAAPFLRRYIRFVAPELIIFGGIGSYELFRRVHAAQVSEYGMEVRGPYRGRNVRLFLRATLAIPEVGSVQSAAILHPSKRRWREVLSSLSELTKGINLPEPIAAATKI